MKILLAAGATLLIAMVVPFQANVSSSTTAPDAAALALAIGPPIAITVPAPAAGAAAGPGILIVVGTGLIALGSLVRRVSRVQASRPE